MNSNSKMTLLTTFTYQVRAGNEDEGYDQFIGDKTDYDFETAKKVYDENKNNYYQIAITMTPSLCEEEFNELADELNIHLKYEVKYILEKNSENMKQCSKCGKVCVDYWFVCGDCCECFCSDCDKALNPHASGKCKVCEDDKEDEEIGCRYCGAEASVPCDETKCPFRICNRIDREQNKQ